MLLWPQAWLRRLVAASGAAFGLLGIAAWEVSTRHDLPTAAATAIVPPVMGAMMVGGALRWPRLLVPASTLMNVEAVLGGWLFVNGMAFAIMLPFVGLGLLQPARNPQTVRLGYIAGGVAAIVGAILAVLIGPTSGLAGVYPPVIALPVFAVLTGLALAFNWRTSGRLIEAIAEAKRELAARQGTEEELRRTSQLLTSILDSSPITTMAFGPDRTVTVWNRTAERVFGWTAAELIGEPLPPEMTPADDRERSADRIRRTFAGEVIKGDLVRRLTKQGEVRWAEIYAAPLPEIDGKPIGIAGQFVDVTERMALDAELRRTQETLEAVIAAAPLAIVLTDCDGVVQVWNRAAERIYGPTTEEAVGRHVTAVTGIDPAQYELFRRGVEAGESIAGLPLSRQHPDGHVLDLRLFLAPLRDKAGLVIGAVSIIEDVSERRSLENQLRQAQKMETLGQLAGSIAHDFNNLLTAIRGFAEMAASSVGSDHEASPDLEEVQRAADRAADLTTRLLAFSRATPTGSTVVELNAIIEGMAPMLRRLAGPTIELWTALDPSTGYIRVDAGQLEQAVLNLVVNARDAMPAGGSVTIATQRRVSPMGDKNPEGEAAVLTIADTGVGMGADVVERAFEPFFTTKGAGEGTGLGLAIVFGVVQNANGEVAIESSPGAGSTFRITLPAVAATSDLAAAVPRTPSRGTETILLVDDEVAVRLLAQRALVAHGYHVTPASNADAAVGLWEATPGAYDMLLTDVTMPGRSGIALAQGLQVEAPDLRVLFMSGYVPGGRGLSVPAGMPFIHKPFVIGDLLRSVRAELDREPTAELARRNE